MKTVNPPQRVPFNEYAENIHKAMRLYKSDQEKINDTMNVIDDAVAEGMEPKDESRYYSEAEIRLAIHKCLQMAEHRNLSMCNSTVQPLMNSVFELINTGKVTESTLHPVFKNIFSNHGML